MTFDLYIQTGKTRYKLTVEQTVATDWIEEYKITAGQKVFVFRNNRPEIRRVNRRVAIKWQLISKNWDIEEKDIKTAAEFFVRVQHAIEDKIERPPSFQEMRNK